MDLKVRISDEAKNWLMKKSSKLTIASVYIQNCCVPLDEIAIHYKEPDYPNNFYKFQIDQLDIFIEKSLRFKNDELTITLSGFGPFQSLNIGGISRF